MQKQQDFLSRVDFLFREHCSHNNENYKFVNLATEQHSTLITSFS